MPDLPHLRPVRATYDTVAVDYARLIPDLSYETRLDIAMLASFADPDDDPPPF